MRINHKCTKNLPISNSESAFGIYEWSYSEYDKNDEFNDHVFLPANLYERSPQEIACKKLQSFYYK